MSDPMRERRMANVPTTSASGIAMNGGGLMSTRASTPCEASALLTLAQLTIAKLNPVVSAFASSRPWAARHAMNIHTTIIKSESAAMPFVTNEMRRAA
jgi:hypothetical protein